ncbi:unnamed protein product [Arabis nemorensis]|uniref:Uncharacterized protein n=1 Tax=Arabis nemorensis TaxID=586526 RepID=A0A565ANX7_9BRAS|nr:unnamed protein product [Arabis nemorensis]
MPQLDRSSLELIVSVVVDGDYYGGFSAAVPFKWESQPGTPRRLFKRSSPSGLDSDSEFNSPVPAPLTPPPSYFQASPSSTKPKKANTPFGSLLPKNRSSLSKNRRRSMWLGPASSFDYGSNDNNNNNVKSSGCYASIIKVLLRDIK